MDNQPLLWSVDSFEKGRVPEFAQSAYFGVLPYITEFLTSKHPYRNGRMCPFMPQAIKNQEIYFTYLHAQHNYEKFISNCLKFYASRTEKKSSGAIILLFPEDFSIEKLLEIHIKNKEQCIRSSMMLGALYKTSSAPSLHSADYFPLRTPTPILVLRDIAASDLVFLEPEHYSLRSKHVFLTAFIRHFSAVKRSRYVDSQLEKAELLRKNLNRRIFLPKLLLVSALATAVTLIALAL
jgi:hypothetical protein